MPLKKKSRRMSRERIMRLVERFDGEVNNAGFDQFFRNSAGNETAEMIEALEIIGAAAVSSILKRAAQRFPGGIAPKERTSREDLLGRISPHTEGFNDLDQEFYSCSEDLTALLEKYMGW
jgi:hypothetical protein